VVDTLSSVESVTFNDGQNFFVGSASADTVTTGTSAAVASYFDMGAGNDSIYLNADSSDTDTADVFVGGTGTDTIYVASDNDTTTGAVLDDLSGIEKVAFTAHSTAGNNGMVTLTFTSADTTAITIDATAVTSADADRTIVLTDAEADGYYTILGGAGEDTISTGDGGALVTGGAGNDTIAAHAGVDTITYAFGGDGGIDTITSFAAGTDILDLTGTNDVSLTSGDASGFLLFANTDDHVIIDGLTVFSGAATLAADAGAQATAAEVATFLGDLDGTSGGSDNHAVTMGSASDVAYVLIEGSNTHSVFARVTGGSDTAIGTADVTILAYMTSMESEDMVAASFADFA
jgi:Ca2+-binding RTX toxin-like protein